MQRYESDQVGRNARSFAVSMTKWSIVTSMPRRFFMAAALLCAGCSSTRRDPTPSVPPPAPATETTVAPKAPDTPTPNATTEVKTTPTPAATAPATVSTDPAPVPDPVGWFEWTATLHGHGPERPGFHKRLRVFVDGQARYFEEDDEEVMPGMKAAPLYCGGTVDAGTKAELASVAKALVGSLSAEIHPPRSGGMSERFQLGTDVRSLERASGAKAKQLYEVKEKIRKSLKCEDRFRDAHNAWRVRWPGDE